MHSRTKHIDIRHNFFHKHISNGNFKIKFIGSENELVDLFTEQLHGIDSIILELNWVKSCFLIKNNRLK